MEPTTRAYTVRLTGDDTTDWRAKLWKTHCTANRTVQVWGDWLLTLRGGLPATIIDDPTLHPVTDDAVAAMVKANNGTTVAAEALHELQQQRSQRLRVVLAVSWLSVEVGQEDDVPARFVVARSTDALQVRTAAVLRRFAEILQRKHVPETERGAWITACTPTLTARIRDEACWVDRSAAFSRLSLEFNDQLNSSWAESTFMGLIGGSTDYFASVDLETGSAADGKDFVIKAGNWLSANWGSGEKSDAGSIAGKLRQLVDAKVCGRGETAVEALAHLNKILGQSLDNSSSMDALFKSLKQTIGWKGRPSKGAMALQKIAGSGTVDSELWQAVSAKLAEEADDQAAKASSSLERPDWMDALRSFLQTRCGLPYRTTKDLIWEHAVTLDHALRRLSVAHSWIKRAEAERERFATDGSLLERMNADAVARLNIYCDFRTVESGAIMPYQIRKSAIDGWDLVVKAWSNADCDTTGKRIDAVHDLQRTLGDDEKWGDSRLFEDLASEDCTCVWRGENGRSDVEILEKFVSASAARSNQTRFKVPAYRHPHACLNPVWVDFGNSRWSISWSALEAINEIRKLKKKLESAKTDAAKKKIEQQLLAQPDLHGVSLGLWNGETVEGVSLRWQGKRFHKDLDLDHFGADGATVTRGDRVSRAAVGSGSGPVSVSSVFDKKDWNGRLQLNRSQLERLHQYLAAHSLPLANPTDWDEKAVKMWSRLNWFLTTSAKLQPTGPFLDYLQQPLPLGWSANLKKGLLSYAPNKSEKRSGRTRIQLSRLPALRVLSLDLGHRYAAACAVWETLTSDQMRGVCKAAGIAEPGPDAMFLHVEQAMPNRSTVESQTADKVKTKRTVYRRIGAETLSDGTPHPAPWARLDRQFLIRLQGEDRPPRRATGDEFNGFNSFRRFLGLNEFTAEESLDLNGSVLKTPLITDIMNQAVRVARLGLRRLSDRARIAFAMTAMEKPVSGGRMLPLNGTDRMTFLQDALLTWHQLATSSEYVSSDARELWDTWIVNRCSGPSLVMTQGEMSRPARKRSDESVRDSLAVVASQLADPSCELARKLNSLWTRNWQEQELAWRDHLHWLRRLIMPRLGQRPPRTQPEARKAWKEKILHGRRMGGLSYDRLRAFRGLYECMKAFRMRPEPDNLRKNISDTGGRELSNFGRRILDQFEKLREQRIKQLASRVIEGALGVGREVPRNLRNKTRDKKRPTERCSDIRFQPCHAVIVENLRNYRPEESRLRKMNRRLADWAAANVRKYIKEGCELHGLHFDDVPAAYTSRQDSRTGATGVRAEDVPLTVLLDAALGSLDTPSKASDTHKRAVHRWASELKRSAQRVGDDKGDARDHLLVALAAKVKNAKRAQLPDLLLLPRQGGELFLPIVAEEKAGRPRSLQADLNAAANIGLVALLDPDFSGSWWRVKVNPRTGAVANADFPGCPLFEDALILLPVDQRGGKRDRQNAFSIPSATGLQTRDWKNQWAYWPSVLDSCCARLAAWYGLDR